MLEAERRLSLFMVSLAGDAWGWFIGGVDEGGRVSVGFDGKTTFAGRLMVRS